MTSRTIQEFTGMAAIPPVGQAGFATSTNPKLRREKRRRAISAVEAFLGDRSTAAPAESTSARQIESAVVSTIAPVVESAPTPAPVQAVPAVPAPVVEQKATSALMISRDIVEALARGQSVTVRGVLLEPTFKPTAVAPVATPKPAVATAPMPESAAEAMLHATSMVESAPVDMHAAQPPPAPSTNGKAVSAVFHRWGAVT